MRVLVASAAVAVLVFSASQAEARARFKFPSFTSRTTTAPVAAARPARSGIAPAIFVGSGVRAGTRDEMPTGSMVPAPAPAIIPPAARARTAAKPAFVCAQDRTIGAGMGFCELN